MRPYSDGFSEAVWRWFLKRAKVHSGYGWSNVEPKVADHLAQCGIDMEHSELPDMGVVSEFDGTDNDNVELPAITPGRWVCRCGKYGTTWEARRDPQLAVPGPYPLGHMIYEVIKESEQ